VTTLNLFSNRATAKLAADVIAGDTALTLVTGEGARFPALAAGQYFRLVLQKGTGPTDQREYMVCTARAGDVLTVTRAQEGTPAAAFAINDEVSLVATALSMSSFVQRSGVTMQGALEVEAVPTTPLGIATKSYVDTGTLADAPSDSKYYVRRNAAWIDGDTVFATDTAVAGKVAKAGDTMSGALGVADGSMAAPGLNFVSEPATGLFRATTGTLAWAVSGTQVAALGAATSTSSYFSMNPRAAGTSFFQLVNAPYNATNYNSVSFGVDTTHAFFNATKGGSNAAQVMDFIGASAYQFDKAVGVNGDVYSGTGLALMQGSTANPYVRFSADGWKLVFAAGSIVWQSTTSVNVLTCDAVGNLNVIGNAVAAKGYLWQSSTSTFGLTSSGFRSSAPSQVVDIINASSCGAPANIYAIHTPSVASIFQFSIGGGGAAFVMDGGGQGRSPNGWVATSDRSVKANFKVIDGAMAMVRKWTGYTFDKLNAAGEDGVIPRKAGLVAQDVEDDLPEAISIHDGLRYLDLNGPLAVMANALKELDRRLDELEYPA
jgi:hypothetical protein